VPDNNLISGLIFLSVFCEILSDVCYSLSSSSSFMARADGSPVFPLSEHLLPFGWTPQAKD
jgi:hypothetical protein